MAEHLGWRWEFGIQLPLMAISLTVAILAVPRHIGMQNVKIEGGIGQAFRDFDFKGSVLLTSCVTSLTLGVNLGGNVLPCKSSPFPLLLLI